MQRAMRVGVLALVMAVAASGGIIVDLDLSTSSISPGDSFTATINLLCDAGETVGDVSFWLTASQAGWFTITDRSLGASPLDDPQSTNAAIVAPAAAALLNPTNGADLGASTDPLFPVTAASIFLCTLTIQSNASTPAGLYTFIPSLATGSDGAPDFNEFVPGVSGDTLAVLVPEPGALAFLLLGLPSALLLRRRRS